MPIAVHCSIIPTQPEATIESAQPAKFAHPSSISQEDTITGRRPTQRPPMTALLFLLPVITLNRVPTTNSITPRRAATIAHSKARRKPSMIRSRCTKHVFELVLRHMTYDQQWIGSKRKMANSKVATNSLSISSSLHNKSFC